MTIIILVVIIADGERTQPFALSDQIKTRAIQKIFSG